MQIIILAAGMGNRLKPITNKVPKVMVKVAGKEIIFHQLDLLSKLKNVSEIIVVTGYKKNLIKNLVGQSYKGKKITYVDNDDYTQTNNIYSLYLALKKTKEDVLLLEGDVIFKPDLLGEITKYKKDLIFVEKFKPYMDGGVVDIDAKTRQIKRLIPKRDQDENFEFSKYYKTVNIYYFTYSFIEKIYKPSLELYINSYGKKDYYELIIGSLVYLNLCHLYAYVINKELQWFEIDDFVDLNFAENIFIEKNIDFIKNKYGGYWNYDFIDFCYLYNRHFPNISFIREMMENVSILINTYPSGQEYIKLLLSSFFDHEINRENLFVGNGASELINIINDHIIDSITIPIPTFSEYLNVRNKELINFYLLSEKNGFKIIPEKLIKEAKKTNFLLLINPNNPTGQSIPQKDLIYMLENLKSLKGIILDESFIDFSDQPSNIQLVEKYPNLIFVKSISKSYGVAGLRLGYVYTKNQKVKKILNQHLPIWNINSFAEKFLEKFTKYKENFNRSISLTKKDREKFMKLLRKIKHIKIYPSEANFLLCKLLNKKISSAELCRLLFIKNNIFIKDLSPKMGSSFFRISVRKEDDNKKLIEALNTYL